MARRNSPSSLKNWDDQRQAAPFRASLNADVGWGYGSPDPAFVTAMRVSPGGRLLCAFDLAEVRDYFVDGYLDQGAQVEPFLAEVASARRSHIDAVGDHISNVLVAASERDLVPLFDLYVEARAALKLAGGVVEREFHGPIQATLARGDLDGAGGLFASMPNIVEKTLIIDDIATAAKAAGKGFPRCAPAMLSAGRARALLEHRQAERTCKISEEEMGVAVRDRQIEFMEAGNRAGLEELADAVPSIFVKAFLKLAVLDWRSEEGPQP